MADKEFRGKVKKSVVYTAQVNVLGVLTCTREAVRVMEEQGVDDGHIFLLNRYVYYTQ